MNNPAAYSVSKAGLLQLTRWMSTVLAPKIRVNSISPGGIFRNQPEESLLTVIFKKRLSKEWVLRMILLRTCYIFQVIYLLGYRTEYNC